MAKRIHVKSKGKSSGDRVAIYARVSTEDQATDESVSLDEQVRRCEKFCEGRKLTVAAVYQEVGTGMLANRPEFQRMLRDARIGIFDIMLCWSPDRLARGMYPGAAVMEVVDNYDIKLMTVMGEIDMNMFSMYAVVGKIEADNFRRRSKLGREGKAIDGRIPIGRLPYGYAVEKGGRAVIVEEEARVVREIYRLYIEDGLTVTQIARRLDYECVPTPKAHSKGWGITQVNRMLKAPIYRGHWYYGKTSSRYTDEGILFRKIPEEDWIRIDVPATVDAETWEKAQEVRIANTTTSKRNVKTEFAVRHLVTCAECNRIMGGGVQIIARRQ